MFLSAVWTLILTAPIHYRASIGEQVMEYISPNQKKKQTHLHLGWSEGEGIFSKFLYFTILMLLHLMLLFYYFNVITMDHFLTTIKLQ